MKKIIEDERIVAEKRRIESIAYRGVVYLLLASIVIQQFFLNAPFSQYAVEFFVLIIYGIYTLISSYMKGIDIINNAGKSRKMRVGSIVLTGIVAVLLLGLLSGEWSCGYLVSFFSLFILFMFSYNLIMEKLIRRKQEAIDKELEAD